MCVCWFKNSVELESVCFGMNPNIFFLLNRIKQSARFPIECFCCVRIFFTKSKPDLTAGKTSCVAKQFIYLKCDINILIHKIPAIGLSGAVIFNDLPQITINCSNINRATIVLGGIWITTKKRHTECVCRTWKSIQLHVYDVCCVPVVVGHNRKPRLKNSFEWSIQKYVRRFMCIPSITNPTLHQLWMHTVSVFSMCRIGFRTKRSLYKLIYCYLDGKSVPFWWSCSQPVVWVASVSEYPQINSLCGFRKYVLYIWKCSNCHALFSRKNSKPTALLIWLIVELFQIHI